MGRNGYPENGVLIVPSLNTALGRYRTQQWRWFPLSDRQSLTIKFISIVRNVATLGDLLSEEQLRTLVKDYQVVQKYGFRGNSKKLSGIAAVRARVSRYRYKRDNGLLKPRRYVSIDDAMARYERRGERLEAREQMFYEGQGVAIRKKTDIRANAIKGGHGRGGRIVHRPTIHEESGSVRYIAPECPKEGVLL